MAGFTQDVPRELECCRDTRRGMKGCLGLCSVMLREIYGATDQTVVSYMRGMCFH